MTIFATRSTARPSGPDRDEDGVPRPTRVPHRRLVLVAVGVVLIAALGVWLVAFSSVLGVTTVTVRGTQVLTADQVRAAARIDRGTPLVRLDAGAVAGRVEALPEVASASVHKHWPATVVITVTGRVAVGYVQADSGYRLVDRTGAQFRSVRSEPNDLPRFAVPSGATARATGEAVATVAASLPRALLAKVSSIQALDPTAITLLLTDHRVVRWGTADRSADKARILPALLTSHASQYDLTDPDQPFIR